MIVQRPASPGQDRHLPDQPCRGCASHPAGTLEQHPWIALNFYSAFAAARAEVLRAGAAALASHFDTGALDEDVRHALASDPMRYGIKATRKVLETIADYVYLAPTLGRRVQSRSRVGWVERRNRT
jgi:hypothetical protein